MSPAQKIIVPIFVALILILTAINAFGKNATFTCVLPTERESGVTFDVSEVAAVEFLKDGTSIGRSPDCRFVIENVTYKHNGVYTVVVVDTGGERSEPSDPLLLDTQKTPPKAASQLNAVTSD